MRMSAPIITPAINPPFDAFCADVDASGVGAPVEPMVKPLAGVIPSLLISLRALSAAGVELPAVRAPPESSGLNVPVPPCFFTAGVAVVAAVVVVGF